MRWRDAKVTVTLNDGTVDVHEHVGGMVSTLDAYPGVVTAEGVLTLTHVPGEYQSARHVASYPLTSVRDWRVEEKH